MPPPADLPKRLTPAARTARESAGLTLEEAARKARVSAAYLRDRERTGQTVSFALARKLSRIYGCGIDTFLRRKQTAQTGAAVGESAAPTTPTSLVERGTDNRTRNADLREAEGRAEKRAPMPLNRFRTSVNPPLVDTCAGKEDNEGT